MHDDASRSGGATGRSYRIERLIGTGGAAAVYEARRLGPNGPGERVACKIMHAERRDDPGHRKLVWREAVLGLRFTAGHPSLVEILDFFDDAREQLCIVMELVDGASVAELRGPEQRLPFPVTRRICRDVLEALIHLHGRGVLHRDLSLRNILVTAGGAVKVTDFGLARVMEQGQVHTGTIRGTPMYLSPEAIESHPVDERTDLFSLGAILYDLVTGMPPCGDQHMIGAMFARNLVGLFEPLPPDTPEDLAELITGLIRKDRDERRPQTAADGLALLRDHGQPIASPEELAVLVGPAWTRREAELADARPVYVLAPGHVLAERDDRAPAERASGAPPGRKAGREAESLPGREADVAGPLPAHVADPRANPLPGLVAYFGVEQMAKLVAELGGDPPSDLVIELASDGAPTRVAEPAGDAVPEHIDDARPDALADRAPALVAGPAADAQPHRVAKGASGGTLHRRSRTAGRFVARHAVVAAAIGACLLVLGFLLDDRLRGELNAVEIPGPPVAPAPMAESSTEPGPPSPVAPVAVTPERPQVPAQSDETRAPHRATERAAGPHRKRIDVQRRTRRIERPPTLRWPEPLGRPPSWGSP